MKDIQEVNIKDYKSDNFDLLIIRLEEFCKKYSKGITSPQRIGFYKLVLVTGGNIIFWVDTHECKCHTRSLLTISKGQVELCKYSKNVKGYVILFSEEYINKYPGDLEWIDNLKLFDSSNDSSLLKLSNMEYRDFIILFMKIGSEFKSKNIFARDEILINMIKAILLLAERIKRMHLSEKVTNTAEWKCVSEFKKKLAENCYNSRSVNFYAELLNITTKKLNQITNNFMGKPAKRVIQERLVLESKRLLLYSDQTVKEIGFSLGFKDPTNFNKFFKKFTQITPAEFRIFNRKSNLYH